MLDTCHAASMFKTIDAPNIILLSTALFDESAVATDTDGEMNLFG